MRGDEPAAAFLIFPSRTTRALKSAFSPYIAGVSWLCVFLDFCTSPLGRRVARLPALFRAEHWRSVERNTSFSDALRKRLQQALIQLSRKHIGNFVASERRKLQHSLTVLLLMIIKERAVGWPFVIYTK